MAVFFELRGISCVQWRSFLLLATLLFMIHSCCASMGELSRSSGWAVIFLLLFGLFCGNDITESGVQAHVRFLADDLLEGRETTYRGQRLAAKYIESHFMRHGLSPMVNSADAPYFQFFSLYGARVNAEQSPIRVDQQRFTLAKDFKYAGANPQEGVISGELLFVGYPFRSSKEKFNGIDDAGMEGKIVLAIDGYPPHLAAKFSDSPRRRQHLRDQQLKWVEKAKAKALVYLNAGDFELPDFRPEPPSSEGGFLNRISTKPVELGGTDFPVIEFSAGQAQRLLGNRFADVKSMLQAITTEQVPKSLPLGLTMNVETVIEKQTLVTENVGGVVRGTDPVLRDEYVVLSAHYDHLGVRGDKIYNGADDNASGTSLLMELARYFAAHPTKRSLIFLCLSGEEKGLLGSAFFVNNCPVPLDRIVANVNIDMVGRNEIETIGLIPAANDDVSTLNEVAKRLNETLAQPFRFLEDQDRYHQRSDHYNFCKNDIPAVFFYSGDHVDYHQPSDTWEKVNYAKIVKAGQMVSALLTDVGNSAERPRFLSPRVPGGKPEKPQEEVKVPEPSAVEGEDP